MQINLMDMKHQQVFGREGSTNLWESIHGTLDSVAGHARNTVESVCNHLGPLI